LDFGSRPSGRAGVEVKFISTRGQAPAVSVSQAMEAGLAPDGGLYVPESFPVFDFDRFQSYPELAYRVLAPFFEGDPLAGKLEKICQHAFSFPIPLKDIDQTTSVLELFHGPTSAFKDVGARFLAECLVELGGPMRTIIVATSGDTGGAVAAAFHGKPGVQVVILFPKDGVSERQKKQLTCWGDNIHSFAVQGDFDDCQKAVKQALSDENLRAKLNLSSANSISVGRLLPQATYYAMASLLHKNRHHSDPSFVIPSGNVGNAVAALWAKKMGFPIGKIVLATNANRVVPDYFHTKEWKPASSVATLANAMDVGNPSNMERVFNLEKMGFDLKDVSSISVSDDQIRETIRAGEKRYGEIWCPHTATAVYARELLKDMAGEWIVVSTAHPAKFETIVEPLIGHKVEIPEALAKMMKLKARVEDLQKVVPTFWLRFASKKS
jgi:threonine synthase